MGRKKKKVEKPWCWYCNREFDDDKILIQHQKAKHFKCHICHKKLFSGPGLSIHCMQVHKETIDKIPGAAPGRDSIHVEIYGMQGIPTGAYRGAEEPEEKRARIDMPPMPGPPMPAMPYQSYNHYPPMPPMPPASNSRMPPYMPPAMAPGMMPPHAGMPPGYGRGYPPGAPGMYGRPAMPPGYPPAQRLPPTLPPPRGSRFDSQEESRPAWQGRGARTPPLEDYGNGHGSDHGYGGHEQETSGRHDYNDRYKESEHVGDGDRYRENRGFEPKKEEPADYPEVNSSAPPLATSSTANVASKLGSRTRIIHPDDHSVSLEERRVKNMFSDRGRGFH